MNEATEASKEAIHDGKIEAIKIDAPEGEGEKTEAEEIRTEGNQPTPEGDVAENKPDSPLEERPDEDGKPAEADTDAPDLENFQEVLEALGIDHKKHEVELDQFYDLCKQIGIIELLNNIDLTEDEKAKLVKNRLIEAEKLSAQFFNDEAFDEHQDTRTLDPEAMEKKGLERFKSIGSFLLSEFAKWSAEGTKDTFETGVLRFIKALFEGANYNSASSLRQTESEKSEEVVSEQDFILMVKEKPRYAAEKILNVQKYLETAGWSFGEKGRQLLNEVKNSNNPEVARKNLQAILVSGGEGVESLAQHLTAVDHVERWKSVSGILAKELFSENKKMLSFSIKENIDAMRKGDQNLIKSYFGS